MDPLLLSRLQFAWVVAFHILLPAFTVDLASSVAVLEGMHLATRKEVYLRLSMFWTRIFAVSFGIGVVSGIVMPFQFGTNWSRFSDAAANVVGPLMAYEGLTAFFLEAAFLGVLLFGRKRVPEWAHFFSALSGYVIRVSGVNAIVRLNNPKGTRIEHLDIAGAPFHRDRRYRVAVGGEQDVKDAENRYPTGVHAIDALRRYFAKHSPVDAGLTHAKFVAV